MKQIKVSELDQYVIVGNVSIDGSMSPDKGSTEKKHFTLDFHFDSVPLKGIINRACSAAKITWVNNVGRPKFTQWKDRQKHVVDFSSPAKRVETREDKIQKYVAMGYNEDVATFAVDHPDEFAKMVNNVVKVKGSK